MIAGSGAAGASDRSGRPALSDYRLVNLAHVNDPERTNVYPGDPEFTLTTLTTVPEHGFYMQYVQQGEHTGTHWGAPSHFNDGEPHADELDAEDLFLCAVKIDVRDRAAVRMALERGRDESDAPERVVLGTHIVVRDSVRPLVRH